jgi:hypothetical protein
MSRKALTYIEIDVPSFVEASPEEIVTYRFTAPCDYLPADIEAIPSLESVGHTPAIISLGKDLGTRASLTITMSDHRHIFNGEAFTSGTFWGKWRARYGTRLQGYALRWIQGLEGQSLDEMEARHFVIEATNGPTPQGKYSITAKDVLKLADGDRAQAPMPNSGFMVGGIDNNDLAFTLSPSGIGDGEYGASGYLALGGAEIVSFTRSSDTVTITGRGQLGTTAQAHEAGSRVQTVLRYFGVNPATIIHDLLVNYAGVDEAYIPLSSWENEVNAYLQQDYSANIAEPTDVNKLISEIIETAALVMWWEPLTQLVRLQVLRAVPTDAATFDEDNTMEGSLGVAEQPAERVSQVFVYFGQRNPLDSLDEENNFRSAVLVIDADAELAYSTPILRKVFSRWIPFGARTVATRLANLILGRFRDPPRRFTLSLPRHNEGVSPELGGGYRLLSWVIQDETGAETNAPIQVTRLNPLSDRYEIQAEEMLFESIDPGDLVNRTIIIDSSIDSVNLRTLHDSIYPDPDVNASPEESLTVIIEENVIVGSTSRSTPAITVGDWPSGYPVRIEVYGRIQGAGGNGGKGGPSPSSGQSGGAAIYTRFPVVLKSTEGEIWGGGGGGGGGAGANIGGDVEVHEAGGGGGGGGGVVAGAGGAGGVNTDGSGSPGNAGSTVSGGSGGAGSAPSTSGSGGSGGAPGSAGSSGQSVTVFFITFTGGSGGSAGRAIDGVSFITLDGAEGDHRGPEVN